MLHQPPLPFKPFVPFVRPDAGNPADIRVSFVWDDHHIVVKLLIALDLVIGEGNKIFTPHPGDEKRAAEDIIGFAGIVQQGTVEGQAVVFPIPVADLM